jgi:hypothetical protein
MECSYWKPGREVGTELKLVDDSAQTTRGYFQRDEVDDILFVISYSADAVAWPA